MKQKILIAFLIISIILNAQAQKKITSQFAFNLNYHLPTWDKASTNKTFLFLQNAQSAGLEYAIIPLKSKFAIKTNANFIIGQNDKKEPLNFAKANNIGYTNINWSNSRPIALNLLVGPRWVLFGKAKKVPIMYFDVQGGGIFTNGQSLKYIDQNVITAEYKTKTVNFAYGANLSIVPLKTKKLMFRINAGYTNFGGFNFGFAISQKNCAGCHCCKCDCCFCGPGCNTATESNQLNK